jgi:tetratricopeptide (TPR) repeat protein
MNRPLRKGTKSLAHKAHSARLGHSIQNERPARDNWRLCGLTVLIAIAVIATHWPALNSKVYSFDDRQYFSSNKLVLTPGWFAAKRFLVEVLCPTTVTGYYQPLTMISLMGDVAMGASENNLMPLHRTSLILHVANVCLIIWLLYLLFPNIWAAAAAGLLYGLHPMTVEPIPWIGERKTLLAAFFSFLCIISYLYYKERGSHRFYAAVVVSYILALMSKPTSTGIPLVLLLLDYWPLRKINLKSFAEKVPLFVIGIISAVITIISQARSALVTAPGQHGFSEMVLTFAHNIIFYLYKILLPVNLSSHYPVPEPLSLGAPMVLVGFVGSILLIAFLIYSLRWTRALLTGWLIFIVLIFPTMGVIGFTNVIAADKYAYLPAVGLLIILCWALVHLFSQISRRKSAAVNVAACILILAAVECAATRNYLKAWKDTTTLFTRMLKLNPNEAPLYNAIGLAYAEQKNYPLAIECYEKSLKLKSEADTHNNYALTLKELGKYQEAEFHMKKAIELLPKYGPFYKNLGQVYQKMGRLDEAIAQYKKALEIYPFYHEAHYLLANALRKQGRLDEAIEEYKKIIQLDIGESDSYNNLAVALCMKGQFNDAIVLYRKAIELSPADSNAMFNLGMVYVNLNQADKAIECFTDFVKHYPNDSEGYNILGDMYYRQGDTQAALQQYQRAFDKGNRQVLEKISKLKEGKALK